ncbi:MAG: glycosyltransferase family 4 protein [Candidatus Margulisbacteria bacterium]|nr:glycosyltransferase family 4 protein [Candidatus Margulisiibacteriota bacterium]
MDKNIRVVWICHFSNKEIRSKIPLSKRKLINTLRTFLGRSAYKYNDFAPWITNQIKEFEKFKNIELHVIAPMSGMKPLLYNFKMRGVFYHFFKPDLPFIHMTIPAKGKFQSMFLKNRFMVNRLIKRIKPDIVNLIGTENPYYSITALDIKGIPVYVSAQTVFSNPIRYQYSNYIPQLNWELELKIHAKIRYYGCQGRMHRDLIIQHNPEAIIMKNIFPIEIPKQIKQCPKKYDYVFFAGLAKQKGVEDLIEALSLVKKYKSDVTLNIVGTCQQDYKNELISKINALELTENIIFDDYFPVHSDMHQHIVQSRIAVLPVKIDIIPSSVIEAILLGLPVITYKTSGTPFLNKDGQSVLLGEIGDIETLSVNMINLLNNPGLSESITENAKRIVEKEFNNTLSSKRIVDNYYAVINHYFHGVPIPENLLFNLEEFPHY